MPESHQVAFFKVKDFDCCHGYVFKLSLLRGF
jgi:hypothetical protein